MNAYKVTFLPRLLNPNDVEIIEALILIFRFLRLIKYVVLQILHWYLESVFQGHTECFAQQRQS